MSEIKDDRIEAEAVGRQQPQTMGARVLAAASCMQDGGEMGGPTQTGQAGASCGSEKITRDFEYNYVTTKHQGD